MIIMEEAESSKTLLHAVDIRAAKINRRLQPVGEILELGDYEYSSISPADMSA